MNLPYEFRSTGGSAMPFAAAIGPYQLAFRRYKPQNQCPTGSTGNYIHHGWPGCEWAFCHHFFTAGPMHSWACCAEERKSASFFCCAATFSKAQLRSLYFKLLDTTFNRNFYYWIWYGKS
jgi:hypothetical protein